MSEQKTASVENDATNPEPPMTEESGTIRKDQLHQPSVQVDPANAVPGQADEQLKKPFDEKKR